MDDLYAERYYESDDGLRLYFRDYAPQRDVACAPVVCLPGLTRNSRDFEPLAARLSASWRILCPDFRGRGRSEYDPHWQNYNPRQYALDVIRLLRHAGVERARFIGTSLGGLVSMLLADLSPATIEAVVMNDIGPEINPVGLSRIVASAGLMARAGSFDEALRNTRANYEQALPGWTEADWRWYTETTYRQTESGEYDLNYDRGIGEAVRAGAAGLPRDPWAIFEALQAIPTMVICGALSDILTPEIVARMQQRKPDLRAVTVKNRGHAPILDEPEAYDAIATFLETV